MNLKIADVYSISYAASIWDDDEAFSAFIENIGRVPTVKRQSWELDLADEVRQENEKRRRVARKSTAAPPVRQESQIPVKQKSPPTAAPVQRPPTRSSSRSSAGENIPENRQEDTAIVVLNPLGNRCQTHQICATVPLTTMKFIHQFVAKLKPQDVRPYIMSLVVSMRREVIKNKPTGQKFKNECFLKWKSAKFSVCRTMFLSATGIPSKILYRWVAEQCDQLPDPAKTAVLPPMPVVATRKSTRSNKV